MNKKALRVLFMGTPDIAADVFLAMINDGYNFVGLIAQEDKPVGRKKEIKPVPTKVVALEHNIPCFQPHKVREDFEFVKELNVDLIITMAYGQIVPQGLLDIPKYGCLNLHGSLLPKYRGASPIQAALFNGDKITGVTLMEMIDKMDAGKMYATEEVDIDEDDNYSSLRIKISKAAAKLVLRELPNYIDGKLKGAEQDETSVSFCGKIKPEDEKLSLDNVEKFLNFVKALSFEPGAYLFADGKKFKILKAKFFDDKICEKGLISFENKKMILALGDGRVSLETVQLEGKSMIDGKSFMNGHQNFNGIKLS